MGEWVLFDYGGVLCTEPSPADRRMLLGAVGLDPDDAAVEERFWAAFWRLREPYDRGALEPADYWARVLERPVGPDELAAIDAADVLAWSRPYEGTLALLPRLAARGTGLALLSNAPLSMAAAIDAMSWTDLVPRRFYSSRLRATKPDPAAYGKVLAELAAEPDQVTFVDDRPANVAGAEAVGLRALLFTDPATLAADLDLRGDA